MNKPDVSALHRLFTRSTAGSASTRAGKLTGPQPVVNDATSYGVAIKPAVVQPGAFYWQAVRVHHLTPAENGGNHHLYMDIFDPTLPAGSRPYGARVDGGRLRVTWDGGEQTVTIDKPANEAGTNVPLWKWQVVVAQALGLPGQELPSDQVTGVHTGHPDEAPGNSLFHHSFRLTFVKVKAPDQIFTESVIYGVIHRAAGRKVILRKNGSIVAKLVLDATEAFRFSGLGAGQFTISVEGTEFKSDIVNVDGRNPVQLDLTLTLSESVISGKVKNGTGKTVRLLRGDTQVKTQNVAADESYRFAGLSEGIYRVTLAGYDISSAAITVTGVNSVTVDLIATPHNRALGHYVLFGPADRPLTRANMMLAEEYLLTFSPAFGFDPAEAGQAGMVTIVADTKAVPASIEQQLKAGGTAIQRISGRVDEVAKALAERVAGKNPFGG